MSLSVCCSGSVFLVSIQYGLLSFDAHSSVRPRLSERQSYWNTIQHQLTYEWTEGPRPKWGARIGDYVGTAVDWSQLTENRGLDQALNWKTSIVIFGMVDGTDDLDKHTRIGLHIRKTQALAYEDIHEDKWKDKSERVRGRDSVWYRLPTVYGEAWQSNVAIELMIFLLTIVHSLTIQAVTYHRKP